MSLTVTTSSWVARPGFASINDGSRLVSIHAWNRYASLPGRAAPGIPLRCLARSLYKAVTDMISRDSTRNWTETICGSISEDVLYTADHNDSIDIQIHGSRGEDLGYAHIPGWREVHWEDETGAAPPEFPTGDGAFILRTERCWVRLATDIMPVPNPNYKLHTDIGNAVSNAAQRDADNGNPWEFKIHAVPRGSIEYTADCHDKIRIPIWDEDCVLKRHISVPGWRIVVEDGDKDKNGS